MRYLYLWSTDKWERQSACPTATGSPVTFTGKKFNSINGGDANLNFVVCQKSIKGYCKKSATELFKTIGVSTTTKDCGDNTGDGDDAFKEITTEVGFFISGENEGEIIERTSAPVVSSGIQINDCTSTNAGKMVNNGKICVSENITGGFGTDAKPLFYNIKSTPGKLMKANSDSIIEVAGTNTQYMVIKEDNTLLDLSAAVTVDIGAGAAEIHYLYEKKATGWEMITTCPGTTFTGKIFDLSHGGSITSADVSCQKSIKGYCVKDNALYYAENAITGACGDSGSSAVASPTKGYYVSGENPDKVITCTSDTTCSEGDVSTTNVCKLQSHVGTLYHKNGEVKLCIAKSNGVTTIFGGDGKLRLYPSRFVSYTASTRRRRSLSGDEEGDDLVNQEE